jgi:hypothetical protein
MLRDEVGRIAAIVVVVMVGVVVRIHGVRSGSTRRRHRRTIAVVVVAVFTRTIVVTRARRHAVDHPRLVTRSVPAEAHWLEVFEGGEAVELVVQFIVRHHRVDPGGVGAVGRNGDRNPSDATRAHSHVLRAVAVAIVGIEVDIEIATIGVISDILNIIVDGDRIGIVGQHGL